jgi:hypothetical protein
MFNRDSAIHKCLRRFCTACKSEDFRFPVSRPDDRAIPSGISYAHYSKRPNNVPYRPDARQIKHHTSGRRGLPSGPSTVSRSFCSSLHPSRRLSSPSERLSVFDQASDSFQAHLWEDCCNCPDDVDSRPDALLLKARIANQIQPSRRQSAIVRTCVHLIWKLRI